MEETRKKDRVGPEAREKQPILSRISSVFYRTVSTPLEGSGLMIFLGPTSEQDLSPLNITQ